MAAPVDFSPIAGLYRWLEYLVFGPLLQRTRCALLPALPSHESALLLGDGDGRFAREYARACQPTHLYVVDISPGMQRLAQTRLSRSLSITYDTRDARAVRFVISFPLVVTHFFLDCFSASELGPLIDHIASASTPGARWLLSEFQLPVQPFARLLGAGLIRLMYWFFRRTTGITGRHIPHYQPHLRRHGFRPIRRQSALAGLLVSELWERPALP